MNLFTKPIRNQETHYYHTAVAVFYKSTDKAVILRDIYNIALMKLDSCQLVDKLPWVYYSAKSLNKRHPQISVSAIKRHLKQFQEEGMLFGRDDLNMHGYDKTLSYTVNFAYYNSIFNGKVYSEGEKWLKALQTLMAQNGPSMFSSRPEMTPSTAHFDTDDTLNIPKHKNNSKELSKERDLEDQQNEQWTPPRTEEEIKQFKFKMYAFVKTEIEKYKRADVDASYHAKDDCKKMLDFYIKKNWKIGKGKQSHIMVDWQKAFGGWIRRNGQANQYMRHHVDSPEFKAMQQGKKQYQVDDKPAVYVRG